MEDEAMTAKQFKYEEALNLLTEKAEKAAKAQADAVALVKEVIRQLHDDYCTDDLIALRTYIDTMLRDAGGR